MMKVELIYDSDCPNVEGARAQLLRAFAHLGLGPQWLEWDRSDPESPAYVRGLGSPAILVNGQDIVDLPVSHPGNCCRVYPDKNGQLCGVPLVETITQALLKARQTSWSQIEMPTRPANTWHNVLAMLPSIGVAMLPKLVCPACWPAYAGLLSAIGLGFVNYTPYLLPLTVLFLTMAVASLAYHASLRRGLKPFALGIIAAVIVVAGKFFFASDQAMYIGIAVLVAASIWNSFPKKTIIGIACPGCVPAGMPNPTGNTEPHKENTIMSAKRKIEVFSAGCPACQETIELVNRVACSSCQVTIVDINDPSAADRAKDLGIRSVPAVVIDGKLADCCVERSPDEETLRKAGLGAPKHE